MGTYAENFTSRYRVQYRAAGRNHVTQFRYGFNAGAPSGAFVAGVASFFTLMLPIVASDFAVLGAEYIGVGTAYSLPTVFPDVGAAPLDNDWTAGDSPRFASFVGRTYTGQPASFYVYGVRYDPGDDAQTAMADFRVTSVEDPIVTGLLAALDEIPGITGSDGASLYFKPYMNIGYSTYYQKKSRRGA